ncbi:MYOM protein, partial [Polyodon spathula]|nr:MYOM protein [Polyodon spathula]
NLPASLSFLGDPLSAFSSSAAVPYSSLHSEQGQCQVMPRCHGLGPRCCSTSCMHPLKHVDPRLLPVEECAAKWASLCVNNTRSRLYRSMENLHWTAVSDSSLYSFSPPFKSVDSEFIFRCTATSHWYDSSSEEEPLQPALDNTPLYSRRVPVRRDLPLFTRAPEWLFPALDEKIMNGDAIRELKGKLRLQSVKVSEPKKPIRPSQVSLGEPIAKDSLENRPPRKCINMNRQKTLFARRITSPEEIKQEVRRRLQLRRQSSTPNLNLHSVEQCGEVVKSRTSESITQHSSKAERRELSLAAVGRKRYSKGRLHIPTFEEFKRMRKRENGQASAVQGVAQKQSEGGSWAEDGAAGKPVTEQTSKGGSWAEDGAAESLVSPVCTSPIPRSPLSHGGGSRVNQHQSKKKFSKDFSFRAEPQADETQSTCCPSLLLEATDLSSYGAKICRMKEGFIGSAFDLIKKSCSVETAAEAPVTASHDKADITAQGENNQSRAVSMTTKACSTESNIQPSGAQPAEPCHPSPACRRSSSDAASDASESVKAQRECRLRPHFSDPMPADAAKRKQLEMKIAAAARLHSQRRHQEREAGPVVAKANMNSLGRTGQDGGSPNTPHRAKQRWSSLSSDSGVVGLTDDKEEEEEEELRSEVERADSGIGTAMAKNWRKRQTDIKAWESHRPCSDCGERDSVSEPGAGRRDSLCDKCAKLRIERKEAILEFMSTECSYGEDLRIIREEFYIPMQTAGLLTSEQLSVVFSNVQELLEVNEKFTELLQAGIDQCVCQCLFVFLQGDEDLLSVCIGEIFLEFFNMLPAFQTYCLQQSTSINMLNTLEKEKELLRIFLDVSQNDNSALRRMNLRSFLMAPLQRVTKYPLLLSRISKATTEKHPDHSSLREAKSRVESHLEHINMKSKQEGGSWSLRSFRRDSRKTRDVINIEMRELSLKSAGWLRESTRFIMEGQMQLSQPVDGQWVRKGSKALKFQSMHVLLMIHMNLDGGASSDSFAQRKPVREAVLVLIKDKSSGKLAMLREPVRLSNCVVSADPDCDDTFELLDIQREAFVLRAAERSRTLQWFRQVKRYSRELGLWKKRRNAMPNIMISTVQTRS